MFVDRASVLFFELALGFVCTMFSSLSLRIDCFRKIRSPIKDWGLLSFSMKDAYDLATSTCLEIELFSFPRTTFASFFPYNAKFNVYKCLCSQFFLCNCLCLMSLSSRYVGIELHYLQCLLDISKSYPNFHSSMFIRDIQYVYTLTKMFVYQSLGGNVIRF